MNIPQAVKTIVERDDFVKFAPPLEQQLARMATDRFKKSLMFDIDVSGGCRQMMQTVTMKVES